MKMAQFQISKYIRIGLSSVIAVTGGVIAFSDKCAVDLTTIFDAKTAGTLVGVIGLIKVAYAAFAPSADKATEPTGGVIVTQKATS
jgi:hypothetical protein